MTTAVLALRAVRAFRETAFRIVLLLAHNLGATGEDRTPDLFLTKEAHYQLCYGSKTWSHERDSNPRCCMTVYGTVAVAAEPSWHI